MKTADKFKDLLVQRRWMTFTSKIYFLIKLKLKITKITTSGLFSNYWKITIWNNAEKAWLSERRVKRRRSSVFLVKRRKNKRVISLRAVLEEFQKTEKLIFYLIKFRVRKRVLHLQKKIIINEKDLILFCINSFYVY